MKMWFFGFFILLFSISSFSQQSPYINSIGVESLQIALLNQSAAPAVLELHSDIIKLETDASSKNDLKRKVDFIERKGLSLKLEMAFRVEQLKKTGAMNKAEIADFQLLSHQTLLIEAYNEFLLKKLDLGKIDASIVRNLNVAAMDRMNIAISNIVITSYLADTVNGQLKAENKHLVESINRLDSLKSLPDSTRIKINLEVKEN